MVFKLRNMKKILILLIIVSSCKIQKQPYQTNNFERDEYILAYKKCILYGCIEEATNNNFNKFSKENNDLGLTIERAILYSGVINEPFELGKKMAKDIRIINYSDYEGRKPIFSDCVSFAFSKETDSIASISYKKYKMKRK